MPKRTPIDVEAAVIDVLKSVSRRPIEPTAGSDLVADLGFDSLQVLEVVAVLEDRFDITIPLDAASPVKTVAEVAAHVSRIIAAEP